MHVKHAPPVLVVHLKRFKYVEEFQVSCVSSFGLYHLTIYFFCFFFPLKCHKKLSHRVAFPLEFRLKEVNFIYMYRHTSVENDLFLPASRRTARRAAVCCTACQQWWCIVALVPIPVIICAMC